jgi:hypothetical protein
MLVLRFAEKRSRIERSIMNKQLLNDMTGLIKPWKEDFGSSMEQRGQDGMSWYDLSVNLNSAPCEPELAIIVTSWEGHLKWLEGVLKAHRRSGALLILAYDNPFYPWQNIREFDVIKSLPNPKHLILAHHTVYKHITYDSNKRNGWFWNMRMAQGLLKNYSNIKHVYFTNGDCTVEKPEGFKDLITYLGDNDIMAGQNVGEMLHTADVICKVEAFHKIFDKIAEFMRYPVMGSRSPEVMLQDVVQKLGLKVKYVDQNPMFQGAVDPYARLGGSSTFKDIIGFRNLFAEQEEAWNNGWEPLDRKYFDNYHDWVYCIGDEKETLCNYYDTKDRRYLMQWWDRGEDSDYNRLYYPIEHYGTEPIYAKEN